MSVLSLFVRVAAMVVGLGLLPLGALALGGRLAPESRALEGARRGLLAVLPGGAGVSQALVTGLEHTAAPWALPAAGALAIGLACLPRRRRRAGDAPEVGERPRGLARRRLERHAARLARRGRPLEGAELLLEAGLVELAARRFGEAGEHTRAAELLHDQNCFAEAAEMFARAGRLESAGEIFAGQEQWDRAAACFLEAGKKSVAAEMFERAGEHRRAGDCYLDVGFDRHAARAFVRCQAWERAAEALERVIAEESHRVGTGQSPHADEELRTLVLRAGKLWEQTGVLSRALSVLEQGGCPAAAGEIAMRLEQYEKASELFRTARDAHRAAEALRRAGLAEEAARVLGEHHRDRGDDGEAARLLEQARDWSAAADLYRKLEDYTRAGSCYERYGEPVQAAEMFRLGGDLDRAAACYEQAGCFAEAAECVSELGDPPRRAELLERAGCFLEAGRAYRECGRDGEAVRALQRIEDGSPDFAVGAALLGEIFREKGMHSLAVKKLRQAVDGESPTRDNIEVFYALASLCESRGDLADAADLYERILACDYHHRDAAERQALVRERLRLGREFDPLEREGDAATPTAAPGRYQVIEELGRGGMGIVYKARDTLLDRLVAYKVLPDALRENPRALKNFLREAKSAAQLNHPNIVTVHDVGEQDGRFYIAMEYVDGITLKAILRRRRVIPPKGVLHILVQLAQALAYAHDKKIVHRDIKTANAMWTRDRKAKIMDFGLAKVVEEVCNQTTLVSGTPYYMSPEQTLGRNVDHRTDIYSLGVTLFEMATGRLPFREGNVPYHHVHSAPPSPADLAPGLPDVLVRVIARCLAKSPEDRYQTAHEILAELRASRRARPAPPQG